MGKQRRNIDKSKEQQRKIHKKSMCKAINATLKRAALPVPCRVRFLKCFVFLVFYEYPVGPGCLRRWRISNKRMLASSWRQDAPKMLQDGAKMAHVGAERLQDGAKMVHVGAKMLQDGVKMAHVGAKMLQDGAEVLQNGPCWRQDARDPPRWLQHVTRMPSCAPDRSR